MKHAFIFYLMKKSIKLFHLISLGFDLGLAPFQIFYSHMSIYKLIYKMLDDQKPVDVVTVDFSKAFDKVTLKFFSAHFLR